MRDRLVPALLACLLWAPGCIPCDDLEVELGAACTLPEMAADTLLEIQVREACGTNCAEDPACTARRSLADPEVVEVITTQTVCQGECVPDGSCALRTVPCLLPALLPGTYTIQLPGLGSRTVVIEPGAPSSCSL